MDYRTQFLLILLSILIAFSGAFFNPYCNTRNCHNSTHTLCRFPIPLLGHRCGILIRHGLTAYEIHRIVELHNQMRAYVYSGRERRGNPGPLPRAENYTFLTWDNELSLIAQRWAEQCDYRHDICRNVDRFLLGQIIGYETTTGNVEVLTVDLPIQKWYDEVQRFDRNHVFKFNRDAVEFRGTEGFTQMIWAHTIRIGCGAMRYFDGVFNRFLLVCNYAPRGNYSGKSIYPTTGRRSSRSK